MTVRISRRQALLGASALSVGGAGWLGRFAIGDNFESHVASLIGLGERVTHDLLAALRDEIGSADYDARATALVAATTVPARLALPAAARREAVEAFIGPLMDVADGLHTPYVLAGIQGTGRVSPCGGRLRA